jgi:hypothetical protein
MALKAILTIFNNGIACSRMIRNFVCNQCILHGVGCIHAIREDGQIPLGPIVRGPGLVTRPKAGNGVFPGIVPGRPASP